LNNEDDWMMNFCAMSLALLRSDHVERRRWRTVPSLRRLWAARQSRAQLPLGSSQEWETVHGEYWQVSLSGTEFVTFRRVSNLEFY
jgi:hypothetical protein